MPSTALLLRAQFGMNPWCSVDASRILIDLSDTL
jgi:hypothetical protein